MNRTGSHPGLTPWATLCRPSGSGRIEALLVILVLMTSPAVAQRSRFLAFETVIQGSGDAELRWPVSVAAGSALELAVTDVHGSRLVFFSTAGDGEAWTGEHTVRLPAPPLAVVHDGRRYVVALRGLSELATVERAGAEPGRLALPAGTVPGALAATDAGGLLIYDAAQARVLALDDDGRRETETAVAGGLSALAAAPDGSFYAAFAEQARIVRYRPDGRVLAEWQVPAEAPLPAWPSALVIQPSGGLLIADRHAGRIVATGAAGRLTGVGSSKGWKPGRLLFPAGMTALPGGRLAIADRGNGRVQIFRKTDSGSPP